ncbi:MAG: DUF1152 domain-containing protein [Sporichthyaceae bacterium]
MRSLLIAAGGGGDAIAAAMLAPLLGVGGEVCVLSWSWDRLLVDPLPGPRVAVDFADLRRHAPGALEVVASTTMQPPAGSTLPRLANELGARLFLMDGSSGVTGMADQIRHVVDVVGANELVLLDVGGDVLAQGGEPRLRSPLADLMALAACTASRLPCRLAVAGPGVDGEIEPGVVLARLEGLGALRCRPVDTARIAALSAVFSWHPSEASGVFAAAACGVRGTVEVRDAGDFVVLDDEVASVWTVDAYLAGNESPARLLQGTTTLDEAAEVMRETLGVCELDYERAKAAELSPLVGPEVVRIARENVDAAVAAAEGRGVDYLTVRRLAEVLGLQGANGLQALQAALATGYGGHLLTPFPLVRVEGPQLGGGRRSG